MGIEGRESVDGQVVEISTGDLDRWAEYESRLVSAGVAVPLIHRADWIRQVSERDFFLIVATDENDGGLSAALPLWRLPVRALPGHYRLRAAQFGYAARAAGLTAALARLRDSVREDHQLLGVSVEIFAAEKSWRHALERELSRLGYARPNRGRRYSRTPYLDLRKEDDDLLMSFSSTCRRFIRAPKKKGYSVVPLLDVGRAGRMDELWRETFSRTGGEPPDRQWRRHVRFAREYPDQYRIMGIFGPAADAEPQLLGFSCARYNGDHAVYSDGASTREIDGSIPLSYAPMWELIRWASQRGCEWFDFGGISAGSSGDKDDPRGGISDFKRRFTDKVVGVGGEWELCAGSWRSALSAGLRSSASIARRFFRTLGA